MIDPWQCFKVRGGSTAADCPIYETHRSCIGRFHRSRLAGLCCRADKMAVNTSIQNPSVAGYRAKLTASAGCTLSFNRPACPASPLSDIPIFDPLRKTLEEIWRLMFGASAVPIAGQCGGVQCVLPAIVIACYIWIASIPSRPRNPKCYRVFREE